MFFLGLMGMCVISALAKGSVPMLLNFQNIKFAMRFVFLELLSVTICVSFSVDFFPSCAGL